MQVTFAQLFEAAVKIYAHKDITPERAVSMARTIAKLIEGTEDR